jgi:beta-mannosidase
MGTHLSGWQLLETSDSRFLGPDALPQSDDGWIDAHVPGTVAQTLTQAGLFDPEAPRSLMERDAWYRCRVAVVSPSELVFDCLAGVVDVWFDNIHLARHNSMFVPLICSLPETETAWLHLCFRAMESHFPHRLGRARWRPRMIQPSQMRTIRQTSLGHMPGWCPQVVPIGPAGPVNLRPAQPASWRLTELTTGYEASGAFLRVRLHLPDFEESGWISCAGTHLPLVRVADGSLEAHGPVPGGRAWMPHSHGEPCRYELKLHSGRDTFSLGWIGFRQIDINPQDGGFGFVVNGLPLFCRGVCWTPPDLLSLNPTSQTYRDLVFSIAAAGMNMIRVSGTMLYEQAAFFDACDEAGVLVWHDFMLANFDYPVGDADFMGQIEGEIEYFLTRTRHHPCLALLCGGSEVRQQAEMLGLQWPKDDRLFEGLLPALCARLRPDVPYLPNTPWGGTPAFSTGQGVTHYYGVGAYMRPLDDARRAGVRFASECMALAHIPGEAELAPALAAQPLDLQWKRGTPRDAGASWDFDDVRDHYLGALYGVEPARLRREEPARYLELGRAVSCDLAEALFSEWRRPGSSCRGALIWQLRDLFEGAGWGLLDQHGRAKPVWHALGRVLQPVQVLLTDEGLDGLGVHVVNESSQPLRVELSLEALRDGERVVISGRQTLELPAASAQSLSSAALFGRFFDASYAYRFGPPSHDVTIAVLRAAGSGQLLSYACHLQRRQLDQVDLGITGRIECADGQMSLVVSARRFAQYVHFISATHRPSDDWFHLPPGIEKRLLLTLRTNELRDQGVAGGRLNALNSNSSTWIKLDASGASLTA